MSWLSEWVKKKLDEGIYFDKRWDKVNINGFLMGVARFFGRGKLFICDNCKWEWNVYGKLKRNTGSEWVKITKMNAHVGDLVVCPNCGRSIVHPKDLG